MFQVIYRRRSLRLAVLLGLLVVLSFPVGRHLGAWRHLQSARQALDRADVTAARAELESCLQVWPQSIQAHCLAARAARRAGDYEAALQHLNKCRQLDEANETVKLESALLRAQQGDTATVERFLWARVEQGDPDSPSILEALAKGYAKTFHLWRALATVQEWLERQPNNAQAWFWHGQIRARLCREDEALEDYARAVELDPEADDARLFLAEGLLLANRAREALEHYQYLAQRLPTNGIVQLGLARCWNELGELDKCRQYLDERLAADPRDGRALLERGKLALASDQVALAEDCVRKALAVIPHEDQVHYLLALCLQRQGKKEEAQRSLAEVDRIHEDVKRLNEILRMRTTELTDPGRRCDVAALLLRIGREAEGLGWLRVLLQEQPGYQPAHKILADYYERAGDKARAAQHRRLVSE